MCKQQYELMESDNDFSCPNCKVCDALMQIQDAIDSQANMSQSDNKVNDNTEEMDSQNIKAKDSRGNRFIIRK